MYRAPHHVHEMLSRSPITVCSPHQRKNTMRKCTSARFNRGLINLSEGAYQHVRVPPHHCPSTLTAHEHSPFKQFTLFTGCPDAQATCMAYQHRSPLTRVQCPRRVWVIVHVFGNAGVGANEASRWCRKRVSRGIRACVSSVINLTFTPLRCASSMASRIKLWVIVNTAMSNVLRALPRWASSLPNGEDLS